MDDTKKDIIDLITKMLLGKITGQNEDGMKDISPSIVGVKVVVSGDDNFHTSPFSLHDIDSLIGMSSASQKNQLELELIEDNSYYIIQTEIPGNSKQYAVDYQNGNLVLRAGPHQEYVGEIALSNIKEDAIKSEIRNGVLKIICDKEIPSSS